MKEVECPYFKELVLFGGVGRFATWPLSQAVKCFGSAALASTRIKAPDWYSVIGLEVFSVVTSRWRQDLIALEYTST